MVKIVGRWWKIVKNNENGKIDGKWWKMMKILKNGENYGNILGMMENGGKWWKLLEIIMKMVEIVGKW